MGFRSFLPSIASRKRRALIGLALAGVVIAALNGVVLAKGDPSTRSSNGAPEAPFDCALVLGAGVKDDGQPSWVLEDRLAEALDLYRSGRVKKLLLTGDHRSATYDEPNAMRAWLEANGVPPADLFLDHAGVDTYSSMWRAKHVFGISRMIVVTQAFHLPRALFLARSFGIASEAAKADRRRYRGAAWLEIREVASRSKAFVDVLRGRRPRHAGPPVSLEGDGRVTAG